MVALKIDDIKAFTSKLFVGTVFDRFLVREINIVTFNSFTIDGHIRQGYYSDQELEDNKIEDQSSWQVMRPICFSLIKGKKLPGSFQITLQLSPAEVERFLKSRQLDISSGQINGIYMNIRYEDQILYCISGTSLNIFTLDKALDHEWDEAMRLFLREHEIIFMEDK
ncbi:MAG: DUF5721 family protein [Lachnospiraceae bacterium]